MRMPHLRTWMGLAGARDTRSLPAGMKTGAMLAPARPRPAERNAVAKSVTSAAIAQSASSAMMGMAAITAE